MKKIINCGVCGSSKLEVLWELPNLPLTEKYGKYSPEKKLSYDQKLLFCDHCSHIQLGYQLPPEELYTAQNYSFRTSDSKTACHGTEIFYRFFIDSFGKRKFQEFLDIGGNDLFLAKKAKTIPKRWVVDPVCSDAHDQVIEKINIIGKFIEEVDFKKKGLHPDLIFCRHVLEHISKPKDLLQFLFTNCNSDAIYVFEIPCFENLVESLRFDAIFHQHYHYFDLETFKRVIYESGGEYISHIYNRQGSCGGSLLISFCKAKSNECLFSTVNVLLKKRKIQQEISCYKKQMKLLSVQLKKFERNIYGYGASLMLATLAYHLETDFSELLCVLDDDHQKHDMEYQNLPVLIQNTEIINPEPNCNYLITSLENTRKIFSRLQTLTPRRILLPFIV